MDLLELILELEKYPLRTTVRGVAADGHSYRGDYSDFALEPTISDTTVGELSKYLYTAVLEEEFPGYKGGNYVMSQHCYVHYAPYGCTGPRIAGVALYGGCLEFVLEEDYVCKV